MLFGHRKLYAIPPDLVAQCVKLDLAKYFRVPLCKLYERKTSIFLVPVDESYYLARRPSDIREVRDEERLITLVVWRHDDEACSWQPTHSSGHRLGPKFFGKLTGPSQRSLLEGWALSMSPSGEDIPILALGRGVKVVS